MTERRCTVTRMSCGHCAASITKEDFNRSLLEYYAHPGRKSGTAALFAQRDLDCVPECETKLRDAEPCPVAPDRRLASRTNGDLAVSGSSPSEHAFALDVRVASFASAVTRMLLASEGMTTPLLQAAAGVDLRPETEPVRTVTPGAVPQDVRRLLRVQVGDRCLVRLTRLVTPAGLVVSDNAVIVPVGVDAQVEAVARDQTRPLGFGLATAGVRTERRILYAGPAHWPEGGPCASKVYLLLGAAGRPLAHIRELFSPRFIPGTVQNARPTYEKA